ncbi:MAG: hypothetical protein LBP51_03785 [Deferribacteraceae bacterium]|jgi:predicted RNA methylase|nr:hypothetical protein [Deferribacteraceae bacterium]
MNYKTCSNEQTHLNHIDTINLGAYYTPKWLIEIVYSLIRKAAVNLADYYILDTSCGYGGFLRGAKAIGADIDEKAVKTAKSAAPQARILNHNSLFEVSRLKYGLDDKAKIIIVGNPPYNDVTSIIRNRIKKAEFLRDADLICRDLGISFLLSYNKLEADFVSVLHPLSYLIKRANFEALSQFKDNYRLIDALVVSSSVFSAASKTTSFPIVIALYKRTPQAMNYEYIRCFEFKSHEGLSFSIKEHDIISNYISKYPNHKVVDISETVAHFHTMRDINALKRAATFIKKENHNTIRVTKDRFPYYCYVDVFKEYIPHIPYYLGNSDIMIDDDHFRELKPLFINRSIQKHPELAGIIDLKEYSNNDNDIEIERYFQQLLGEHYVD